MDRGELSVGEIMKTCNVSQSLVYKWRADVKASRIRTTTVTEDTYFAEVIVEEERDTTDTTTAHQDHIQINGHALNMSLPVTYPVEDLVNIILAIKGHA